MPQGSAIARFYLDELEHHELAEHHLCSKPRDDDGQPEEEGDDQAELLLRHFVEGREGSVNLHGVSRSWEPVVRPQVYPDRYGTSVHEQDGGGDAGHEDLEAARLPLLLHLCVNKNNAARACPRRGHGRI